MDEEIKLKFAEMQAVIDALKAHIEMLKVAYAVTSHSTAKNTVLLIVRRSVPTPKRIPI